MELTLLLLMSSLFTIALCGIGVVTALRPRPQ
jgi:hypothetical protein